MPDYRACIMGNHDSVQSVKLLVHDDDDAAIAAASRFVDGHDVEVWDRDRKVARLRHGQ